MQTTCLQSLVLLQADRSVQYTLLCHQAFAAPYVSTALVVITQCYARIIVFLNYRVLLAVWLWYGFPNIGFAILFGSFILGPLIRV